MCRLLTLRQEVLLMNKKTYFVSNFGFSSILMIFIMICFVTFAALSLLSANSDYKLSKKTAEKASAYYQADAAARSCLLQIDRNVPSVYQTAFTGTAYLDALSDILPNFLTLQGITDYQLHRSDDSLRLSFCVTISEVQSLCVDLAFNYPRQEEAPFYQITGWQTVASLEPKEESNHLPLLGSPN